MKNTLFIAFLLFSFAGVYAQQKLTPQAEGSKIHFVIKNFGINTGGDIGGLQGTIIINAQNPSSSSADVTAAIKTIDTDNDRRDRHLQQDEYFNAAKYPTIRIVSTSIAENKANGNYIFTGRLTIRDVTDDIKFPFTVMPQSGGYILLGDFEIDRLKFGVGGESATMGNNISVQLKVFAK